MARFLFALSLLITGFLQATLAPALDLLEVMPDFALVFILIWSSSRGAEEGLLWAFGLGLWYDFLTLEPLGSHAIPLLVVALVGGAVRGRFFRSGAILPVLAVFVATLGHNVARMMINVMSGDPVMFTALVRLTLVSALLNALVVPLVYILILFFERLAPRRVW